MQTNDPEPGREGRHSKNQWVERHRARDVTMQERVGGPQPAAGRTPPPGERAERAGWEVSGLARIDGPQRAERGDAHDGPDGLTCQTMTPVLRDGFHAEAHGQDGSQPQDANGRKGPNVSAGALQ